MARYIVPRTPRPDPPRVAVSPPQHISTPSLYLTEEQREHFDQFKVNLQSSKNQYIRSGMSAVIGMNNNNDNYYLEIFGYQKRLFFKNDFETIHDCCVMMETLLQEAMTNG